MNWTLILIILSLDVLSGREINRTFLIEDEYDKYTSVGNLGLTITNFGILGNGWNKMEDGTINPSCQYKQNTQIIREQIEHFSYCGLWIGGVVNGQRRVSTAIVDGVFESGIMDDIKRSWTLQSIKEGKLGVCAQKCGTEFDPFAAQFQ